MFDENTLNEPDGDAAEDLAAIEFEPAPASADLLSALSEKWAPEAEQTGIALRMAAIVVEKTKAELIKSANELLLDDIAGTGDAGLLEGLMLNFKDEGEKLRAFLDLLTTAHLRMTVAVACLELKATEARP